MDNSWDKENFSNIIKDTKMACNSYDLFSVTFLK